MKSVSGVAVLALLSACQQQDQTPVQRFSLDETRNAAGEVIASPDTADARWTVAENGQAIVFGKAGADGAVAPLLTLECRLKADPAELVVIRHVASRPGLSALFPVIGNGTISRFALDARLSGSEWRWEGALPADDPLNDVFTGTRELEATLPGGGTLAIGASRMPGEFVNWCRAGGRSARVRAAEPEPTPGASPSAKPSAASSPPPAR